MRRMSSLLVSLAAVSLAAFLAVDAAAGRPRCSAKPAVAAAYVIPPAPFRARLVSVRRTALPPGEPTGGGPALKRLYRVTFAVLHGNAVLPAGHRYVQFSYVARTRTSSPWCFVRGGSGP
jgi:hypothetical protein